MQVSDDSVNGIVQQFFTWGFAVWIYALGAYRRVLISTPRASRALYITFACVFAGCFGWVRFIKTTGVLVRYNLVFFFFVECGVSLFCSGGGSYVAGSLLVAERRVVV